VTSPTIPAVVVMGVSGSGKSTVGRLLAELLGADFVDADDLHPAANVAKMAAGSPLTDEDRAPWLVLVGEAIATRREAGAPVVVACSALRRAYRDAITAAALGDVVFVSLDGSPELLATRIGARRAHFMPATLLVSQLQTLEPLQPDEHGFTVSVAGPPADIAAAAAVALATLRPAS
jgi:carbohydrate kinase (thermoresistant glucokinase family)